MALTTIGQILLSAENPERMFKTLRAPEFEQDNAGAVYHLAGNNGVILRCRRDGILTALKCLMRHNSRLGSIYDYVGACHSPLLLPSSFHPGELLVYGSDTTGHYIDVVSTPWAEGNTLEREIAAAVEELEAVRAAVTDGRKEKEALKTAGRRLECLAAEFDRFAFQLLGEPWAHGDLKPENIIVRADGSMVLIDYDAMFIPDMAGFQAIETGTPGYRHPSRDESFYGPALDDYSIALISASLHALALSPELYQRYNRSDIILIHPEEILAGTSEAFSEVLNIFATAQDIPLYYLTTCLTRPDGRIPGLREVLEKISGRVCGGKSEQENGGVEKDGISDEGLKEERGECAAWHYSDTPEMNAKPELFMENGLWGFRREARENRKLQNEGGLAKTGSDPNENTGSSKESDASQWMIEPVFANAANFTEGLASVEFHGKSGFISAKGRLQMMGLFEKVKPFSHSLAAVMQNGKWGFADKDGNIIIPTIYLSASSMREGLAAVSTHDSSGAQKWGYIDTRGNMVIPAIYDRASGFRNGRATAIKGSQILQIDIYNKIISRNN